MYDQTFDRALLDIGVDARGVAVRADWEVDAGVLRTWLRRLRGLCTHPQVGQLLNAADRLHKPGVLKSMEEVLEVHTLVCRLPCAGSDDVTLTAGHERAELAESHGRSPQQGESSDSLHSRWQ